MKWKITENSSMARVTAFLRSALLSFKEKQGLFNLAEMRCQVSMNIAPKTKARDSFGTCTITNPDTHEIIHSRWSCKSLAETSNGEFAWMRGTGRFSGILAPPGFSPKWKSEQLSQGPYMVRPPGRNSPINCLDRPVSAFSETFISSSRVL